MSNGHAFKAFLGVDYGKKRIGLAYAVTPFFLSLPIGVLEASKSLEATAQTLQKVIVDRQITCVVLGNPLPMQRNQISPLQEEITALAEKLKEIPLVDIVLWDERLSSAQAKRMLKHDCGLSRKQRKGKTDALAATLILTSFLESSHEIT
ncbi:Holliday junction resolvase RuvX [Candidatus Chlamydia sanziniae]|uniref:Putative pre-16S rRNA nuclease n=1 Tax=Candidatus Chlamydia sanziniae TaxID=1806891 RepID=A0A1A9HVF9_9CHLA|nr:Holliday junction resolvase RuvX [Candidatus Chlamydia sanziniae]ANH78990.1 hypothetical protein Cs308_0820 [Candidatus Chlamydia sanziniae]